MKKTLAEYAGWYGGVAIISAYLLISLNILSANSYAYQLMNLTGALGILSISVAKGVTQSVLLNIFWAAIAIVALIRLLLA